MIVERSMSEGFLSNGYLVADRAGGKAVLIDTGGPEEPILRAVDKLGVTVTHILCTHHHGDHVSGNDRFRRRFGCPVYGHRLEREAFGGGLDHELSGGETIESGGLRIRALHTPGHTVGQLAFVVNDEQVFTGDTLFRGSVGGTLAPGHATFADLKRSIMDTLMKLPHEMPAHPGHTDPTTIGEEWEHNPFIRVWRGADVPGESRCTAGGRPATLVVRARDYDGGAKCWVRFDEDGRDEIVPGSRVS